MPHEKLRLGKESDFADLADVMFDAVRNGPSLYSEEQRRAWVPEKRAGEAWSERLSDQQIIVAERQGSIVGFMSVTAEGYLDFAYIRPLAQGTGLFRRLFQEIENLARETGISRLWVHASLKAQPAFSAVGFQILKKESIQIRGQSLDRFEMEKMVA